MTKKVFLILMILTYCSVVTGNDSWKNFYGIAWRDTPTNHIRYAHAMGYKTIAIASWRTPGQYASLATNLGFYIDHPFRHALTTLGYDTYIDTTQEYTQAQKNWYESRITWKSNDTWPNNLASGFFGVGTSTRFNIMPDFQQQAVINENVEAAISTFTNFENPTISFTFKGYIVDVPKLMGEFCRWDTVTSANKQLPMGVSYWTGTNSGLLHGTITHEYATYSDGMAAYYKKLNERMKQEFPNAKWIIEPGRIYYTNTSSSNDEWVYYVKDRADKDDLTPDMLITEIDGTEFVDDTNNFNSGMNITKNMVGSSQNREFGESENRNIAIKAGLDGAWYHWFGRFGGSGNMPNFQAVADLSPRLLLIRWIPNQDNLILVDTNGDLLSTATTRFVGTDNGTISYYSVDTNEGSRRNSYLSSKIYWGRDHRKPDRQIYACFLENSNMGTVTFPASDGVIKVWSVNDYYEKDTDITSQFTFTNNVLQPISTFSVNTGSGTGVIIETGQKGRMYSEY